MRCWMSFLALSIALVGVPAFAAEPSAEKQKTKLPAKPVVRVTIAKDTTYITEPLRKDGYPDYVAALNQRMSKGVTPENNAAVLFWQAMGPSEIKKEFREKFFRLLGVPQPPEKGDYFVSPTEHFNRHKPKENSEAAPTGEDSDRDSLWRQFDTALKRPWSKEEFPIWAEWLAANEKQLALLSEACKRPRCYHPLISSPDNKEMVMCVLLPGAQQSRDFARALQMRAMFRIKEGKVDEAWADLLTLHRLARLIGQGSTLVDGLVAIILDGMAQAGDHALLDHAKLSAARIAEMRADLNKLPPIFSMADKLDVGERFFFLDCVSVVAREGMSGLNAIIGDGDTSKDVQSSMINSIGNAMVDWDIVLRMGNSWYDRIVAIQRKPKRYERKKAMTSVDDDIKQLAKSVRDVKSLGWALLGNPRKATGEQVGKIFVALLLPAFMACTEAEDRAAMQRELNELAFALAAYRAEHGSYPAKLADLATKYVKQEPKDIFNNDADLHYTRTDNGYLLYSVSFNGRDDGGMGESDRKAGEDWDDLVVRMSGK